MAYDDEKGGRPTSYDETYHPQTAYELIAADGKPEVAIAKIFRISASTFNLWKTRHQEFMDAVERGLDDWNCPQSEKKLHKKACGFRYIEKTIKINPDTGKKTEVTYYHRYAQPDFNSLKLELTSKRPNRYQDKQHVEHKGNITVQTVDYAKAKEEDSS